MVCSFSTVLWLVANSLNSLPSGLISRQTNGTWLSASFVSSIGGVWHVLVLVVGLNCPLSDASVNRQVCQGSDRNDRQTVKVFTHAP